MTTWRSKALNPFQLSNQKQNHVQLEHMMMMIAGIKQLENLM